MTLLSICDSISTEQNHNFQSINGSKLTGDAEFAGVPGLG